MKCGFKNVPVQITTMLLSLELFLLFFRKLFQSNIVMDKFDVSTRGKTNP